MVVYQSLSWLKQILTSSLNCVLVQNLIRIHNVIYIYLLKLNIELWKLIMLSKVQQ